MFHLSTCLLVSVPSPPCASVRLRPQADLRLVVVTDAGAASMSFLIRVVMSTVMRI
jgi:hypothetical protein